MTARFFIQPETITLDKALGSEDFILGNMRVAGFYRVNYDEENWDKIIKQLQAKKDVCFIITSFSKEDW